MKIVSLMLLVFSMFCTFSLHAKAKSTDITLTYSAHVQALKLLYNNDAKVRHNIDQMLVNLDKDNSYAMQWQGKTAEDLFAFFEQWRTFVPKVDNGLKYVMEFVSLTRSSQYGLDFVRNEPGHSWLQQFTEVRADFMKTKASLGEIEDWVNHPIIRMHHYQQPKDGFASFNDFFIRELKPGTRQVSEINDDSVIVSPADCAIRISDAKLTLDGKVATKGEESYSVKELLDNSPYAKYFDGGKVVRCDLLPHNYHHYHAPVTGQMVESKENVKGLYFGTFGDDIARFHRGYYIFKTQAYGHVAMIPVGMATISSVQFEDKYKAVTPSKPVNVDKGERIGRFEYGGSLVLMLFEKGKTGSVEVQQGQQIGLFKP